MADKKELEPIKFEDNEQFEYPQVIEHTHNGIDSPLIDTGDFDTDIAAYISDSTYVQVEASDSTVDSADTEETIPDQTSYTKYKDIQFNEVNGTIRVYFESKNPQSYSNNIYLRIRVNDVEVGTEVNEGSDIYASHTQDIDVETGDNVQLWAKAVIAQPDADGNLKNFRLQYTKQLKPTAGTVVLD